MNKSSYFAIILYSHRKFHVFYMLQGPASKNPLSYKWYNAEEEILGKKMKVCCLYAIDVNLLSFELF